MAALRLPRATTTTSSCFWGEEEEGRSFGGACRGWTPERGGMGWVTGGMELGWVAGDRGDTAGAVSGGDWDAAPKEQERCQGQAPPGIQSKNAGLR